MSTPPLNEIYIRCLVETPRGVRFRKFKKKTKANFVPMPLGVHIGRWMLVRYHTFIPETGGTLLLFVDTLGTVVHDTRRELRFLIPLVKRPNSHLWLVPRLSHRPSISFARHFASHIAISMYTWTHECIEHELTITSCTTSEYIHVKDHESIAWRI